MPIRYVCVALAALLLAGCQAKREPEPQPAESTATEPAPVSEAVATPVDERDAYTITEDGKIVYQGHAELVGPDEIHITVQDSENKSVVPRVSAKLIIPGIADQGTLAEPDVANSRFIVRLAEAVEKPVTTTLEFADGATTRTVPIELKPRS